MHGQEFAVISSLSWELNIVKKGSGEGMHLEVPFSFVLDVIIHIGTLL